MSERLTTIFGYLFTGRPLKIGKEDIIFLESNRRFFAKAYHWTGKDLQDTLLYRDVYYIIDKIMNMTDEEYDSILAHIMINTVKV